MQLKPGLRLESAACETQVVVVRSPSTQVDLRCGGLPLAAVGTVDRRGDLDPEQAEGTITGKRYADEQLGLEVLCTKGGAGSLSIGEARLGIKDAKPLPSSD